MKGYNQPKIQQDIEKELKWAVGKIDWAIVPSNKILQLEYLLNSLPQLPD